MYLLLFSFYRGKYRTLSFFFHKKKQRLKLLECKDTTVFINTLTLNESAGQEKQPDSTQPSTSRPAVSDPRPHRQPPSAEPQPRRPRARPATPCRPSAASESCRGSQAQRRSAHPWAGRAGSAGEGRRPPPSRPARRARERGPPLTEAAGRQGPGQASHRRDGDGGGGGREGRARGRREAGTCRPAGGRWCRRRPLRAALVSGGGGAA